MMRYVRLLLFPFSLLYGIVVLIRNKLYDTGVFRQTKFDIPVICVGNLVVGGSGKSPVTEYLVRLLNDYKIAVLSRGYGRKTSGYINADRHATSATIGDEPVQFYRKFPNITVAVCEDRVKGINRLKADHDVIILDDAFQHRSVKPGLSILLFEFQKLMQPQFLLPAGNLREQFSGYHRADLLMVTKCPENLDQRDRAICQSKFDPAYSENLLFSTLNYGNLIHVFNAEKLDFNFIKATTQIFLLTGIANPLPLINHLQQYSHLIFHHNYPDHHTFTPQNISLLAKSFLKSPSNDKIVITTEKDAQRLMDTEGNDLLSGLPVYYLPVRIQLEGEQKATFDKKIIDYVSGTTRNR